MTVQAAQTRTIAGREIPPPGRWSIDPAHSEIQFVARHMMIARTRGRFRDFSGTIVIAEVPEHSSVEATIAAASIDTGDPQRDEHLRSPEFLDVQRFPALRFRSTAVRPAGDRWEVTGDLTIRDITRPVTLDVEFCGLAADPWGKLRAAFLAWTEINREDFDVTWNRTLEGGGFLSGRVSGSSSTSRPCGSPSGRADHLQPVEGSRPPAPAPGGRPQDHARRAHADR